MTCSHLYHGNFMLGAQSEERLGHTHVVIEIALGKQYIIFLAKYRSNKFLGGCLAVGASDTYNGDVKLAAMVASEGLECGKAILNEDIPLVSGIGILSLIHNSISTTLVEGRG